MTIIARSEESAWTNDEVRTFRTNTNVHGISMYELQVSKKPRMYRRQNIVTVLRSEARLLEDVKERSINTLLVSNKQLLPGETILEFLLEKYAS
jgi:hypothetical protein